MRLCRLEERAAGKNRAQRNFSLVSGSPERCQNGQVEAQGYWDLEVEGQANDGLDAENPEVLLDLTPTIVKNEKYFDNSKAGETADVDSYFVNLECLHPFENCFARLQS